MIKEIVFNQLFWIPKTADVQNKLDKFDELNNFKNKFSSVQLKLEDLGGLYIDLRVGLNSDGSIKLLSKKGTFGQRITVNGQKIFDTGSSL